MRHKSSESKPRQREAGSEYFETIDSGWTSRDSSSMDRSDKIIEIIFQIFSHFLYISGAVV